MTTFETAIKVTLTDFAKTIVTNIDNEYKTRIESMSTDLRNALAEIEKLNDIIANAKPSEDKTEGKSEGKTQRRKATKKYGKDAIRHESYDDIKKVLEMGDSVFLAGPAGTGKSQLVEMIAEDMGLPFYLSSQITQEYQVEGYQDGNGIYHSTEFYEAFAFGGVFVLEEMDASTPEVLVKINTALANGYAVFPGKGLVRAHKDFHCVATGNTFGTGADDVYTGRNALDASTLDRFIFFTIDYDIRIETKCAKGNKDLVAFVRGLRRAIDKCGMNIPFVISYRGITKMATYEPIFGIEKAMERTIIKGLDADNIRMIGNNLSLFGNKYAQAFKKCAELSNAA